MGPATFQHFLPFLSSYPNLLFWEKWYKIIYTEDQMIMFKVFLLPYWIKRTNPSPYATQITAFSAPLWSRYTRHLRARTTIRPKVKEIASPVALDTNSSPLFYRNLPNIRSHLLVSLIIAARSIQKHQEGKTWSTNIHTYMFLLTFVRYYFLYLCKLYLFMCEALGMQYWTK